MKKNMGKVDKMLRVIVALVIGVLYFNHDISGMLASVLITLALVFFVTSMIGFCPLYVPFKIDTNEKQL